MTAEDNTPVPYRAEAYDKDWTPEQLAPIYNRLYDEYTRLQELTNRARNRYPFEVERALYNQHNRRQRLENELKLLRRMNETNQDINMRLREDHERQHYANEQLQHDLNQARENLDTVLWGSQRQNGEMAAVIATNEDTTQQLQTALARNAELDRQLTRATNALQAMVEGQNDETLRLYQTQVDSLNKANRDLTTQLREDKEEYEPRIADYQTQVEAREIQINGLEGHPEILQAEVDKRYRGEARTPAGGRGGNEECEQKCLNLVMEVSRVEAEKVQLQERIVQLQIILKEARNKGGD